jgi:hypothetical protein
MLAVLALFTIVVEAFPAFPPSDQESRQNLARVITRCSVPNTAALTFVSDSTTKRPLESLADSCMRWETVG